MIKTSCVLQNLKTAIHSAFRHLGYDIIKIRKQEEHREYREEKIGGVRVPILPFDPPKAPNIIPESLMPDYTLGGRIPVQYLYYSPPS
jgi:hypothetical protein